MNLVAVMDQIADRMRTIPALAARTFPYPADKVTPPAAVLSYPESIDPHGTYNRGMAQIKGLTVWVVVARVNQRTARDQIAAYVNSSGATSVVEVLESGTYTAMDDVTVTDIEFDVLIFGDIKYIAAGFVLDITGPGR